MGHAHAVTQLVDADVEVVLADVTQLGASLGIVQQDLGIPEDGSVGPVTIGALTVGVVDQVSIEQEHTIARRSGGLSAAKASVATARELKDVVNLSRQARVTVSQHVGDIDVGSLAQTRVVVKDNDGTVVGLIQASGGQRLTILEQIAVEGVLGHTVNLSRTASVVDSTVSEGALDVLLVQDHLIVTSQVKRVEVGLEISVQAEVARIHDLQASVLGLGEVTVSTVIVVGHILAVVTLIEANLGLHSQSNPLVESGARVGIVGDVGASIVEVLKHLVHHVVAGLTGTVQNLGVIGIEFLVYPIAVTIGANELVVLPSAVQTADTQPVGFLGLAHGINVGHSCNQCVGTTDLYIGSIPSSSATGNVHIGPLSDTGGGLVVVQRVEIVVTTAATITRKGVIEVVGEQLDVGLTGKIVVLGKLIIGVSVEHIRARCQRQQDNTKSTQYN